MARKRHTRSLRPNVLRMDGRDPIIKPTNPTSAPRRDSSRTPTTKKVTSERGDDLSVLQGLLISPTPDPDPFEKTVDLNFANQAARQRRGKNKPTQSKPTIEKEM